MTAFTLATIFQKEDICISQSISFKLDQIRLIFSRHSIPKVRMNQCLALYQLLSLIFINIYICGSIFNLCNGQDYNFHILFRKYQKQFISLNISVQYKSEIKQMKTWCSSHTSHSCLHPCKSYVQLNETAATLAAYDQCDYLSQLNYKLVNQINDAETQKYFYKNRLNHQYRNHSSELEEAYKIISEKNNIILYMEENVDKLKKEFRVLEDDYLCLKNNSASEKEYFQKQLENMQNKYRQKLKNMEQQLQKNFQLKIARRVDEVNKQCEERIKLYKNQIDQLTANSTQLAHELKLMQDQYREMLLKNDLIIQESINRQLRKRDYEAQNNYLRDVSQYEALLKQKRELKEELENLNDKNQLMRKRNNELQALLETQTTKYNDILEAFKHEKDQKKNVVEQNYHLSRQYADTAEADTNTDQAFVPVVMPVDLDLISEIVGLKQFVVQKIVERFVDFFAKTAVTDPKKKSLSLTTFKQSLQILKSSNPQNKILLYIQANLDRIIRLYCPSMNYNKEYLTVKDQFIKRTLMQCETITNPTQKLYRILQLISRLKNPITHLKSEISAGQLRMVQIKFLATLKKVLGQ